MCSNEYIIRRCCVDFDLRLQGMQEGGVKGLSRSVRHCAPPFLPRLPFSCSPCNSTGSTCAGVVLDRVRGVGRGKWGGGGDGTRTFNNKMDIGKRGLGERQVSVYLFIVTRVLLLRQERKLSTNSVCVCVCVCVSLSLSLSLSLRTGCARVSKGALPREKRGGGGGKGERKKGAE